MKGFRGRLAFLSNFYPTQVLLEGEPYPTVEHAFQAAKTLDPTWRELIRKAPTPQEARRLGRQAPLRPDWERVKLQFMEELLRQKFSRPDLKERLLATPEEDLVEWNTWHDRFWGKCLCSKCEGKGEDRLGEILRLLRMELAKEC